MQAKETAQGESQDKVSTYRYLSIDLVTTENGELGLVKEWETLQVMSKIFHPTCWPEE